MLTDRDDVKKDSDDKDSKDKLPVEIPEVTVRPDDVTVSAALPAELAMFTNPSSVLDAFWMYLNYSYFICIFPFRITRDDRLKHKITKNTFQQVLCGIAHALFMLFWIKKWRSSAEVSSVLSNVESMNNPVQEGFIIVLALAEVSYILALVWTAWTKAPIFQRIGNSYHQITRYKEEDDVEIHRVDESLPPKLLVISYGIRVGMVLLKKRFVVGILLCLIYTGMAFKDFWDEYDEEIREGRPVLGPNGYLINATNQFFFLKDMEIPTVVSNALGPIYILVSLSYSLIIHLGNLFYLLLSLMLANLGNNFEKLLLQPDATGKQVLEEYYAAKEFVKHINDELGVLTLFVVLSAVPYYATTLPYVLNSGLAPLDRIAWASNLAHYALVLYLTSTLLEQVKKMREWFSEKKASGIDTGVPIDQQGALMEELNNDAVALSAFGFFSVSYGTIGSILQLLVTYGFIAGSSMPSGFLNMTLPSEVLELEKEL